MLTERQRMILSAIVNDYIRSAEPVGSRSISKRGDVAFSPATIRNEMSDLEEMGFLEQPHTSAGRVPSQKGYRYYVDHLVQMGNLSKDDLGMIELYFTNKVFEFERIIQQVAVILANITNYTSIVLGPEIFNATLKSLQIIPISEHTAVAILVTSVGHVENKTVTIPAGMPMSEIEMIVRILNDKLANVPLLYLKSKLFNEIDRELGRYVNRHEEMLLLIEEILEDAHEDRIFLSGATNMLVQPEFRDVSKVKDILDLLDETETIVKLFSELPKGIQVRIGAENSVEAINDCSLITASYSIGGQPLGTIGVLGPTRMEYGKVISLLDHLSKDLAVIMSKWYR